jgi:hypothetical protein
MAACTHSIDVFLGRPLFLLSSGIHSRVNVGILSSTTVVKRMWKVNSKVIPVIIGATGSISNLFGNYLGSRPEKREIKELHKTVTLGIAHRLREALV